MLISLFVRPPPLKNGDRFFPLSRLWQGLSFHYFLSCYSCAHALEFELIRRFFSHIGAPREDVLLGVGMIAPCSGPSRESAVSVDTLVEGCIFYAGTDPEKLGQSTRRQSGDLAAMGAIPAWATLALTLPESDSSG